MDIQQVLDLIMGLMSNPFTGWVVIPVVIGALVRFKPILIIGMALRFIDKTVVNRMPPEVKAKVIEQYEELIVIIKSLEND